ncbi:MAG TPA: hypothetical protein VG937_32600 [Polyangiaceae bacterium]|jgi:hypothetical protein|nr:hypothetical protein [Polyangiaceae bacterium]
MRSAASGWSWLVWFALFAACSAKEDHAAPPSHGGATTTGGKAGASGGATRGGDSASGGAARGGSGGTGEAGESAGGQAGAGGEAGAPLVTPPSPSVCTPKASWGAPERLELSTAGDDVLGGVTPDELSIVWMSGGEVHYADRDSVDGEFAAAQTIPKGDSYFAQVTLSPDGLALIGVRLDGAGFGVLTRAARADAFQGEPDESPFEALYGAPAANFSNGPFADPVISANGAHLFYSALELESNASASIYDSRGSDGIWPWGTPLSGALLYSEGGAFRRPTGVASDLRTLFYWDELAGEARLSFRPRLDAAFSGWESLGMRRNALPNRACDRLYYAAPGSAGDDLFVSKKN